MAKAIKEVSVNALEKVATEKFSNQFEVQWEGVPITVTPTITLKDMMEFAENVVETCFDNDGDYHPELLDFAVQSEMISKYTNIRLPQNLEKRYHLLSVTGLADEVQEYINAIQFKELLRAIDRKLRYMTDCNIQQIRSEVKSLTDSFKGMEKRAEEMMEGFSAIDAGKLMDFLSGNRPSEEKIVEAYIEKMKHDAEEAAK